MRRESVPQRAGIFLWGRPLGRLLVASRAAVPKKNTARGGPTLPGVLSSAFLCVLCVLCVKAVGSFFNWSLTPILVQWSIPSQSRQIPSHPVPQKCSHQIRYDHRGMGRAAPALTHSVKSVPSVASSSGPAQNRSFVASRVRKYKSARAQ